MVSLNDLPDEVAVKIISGIQDRQCLYNLCLTSRRCQSLSAPVLYSDLNNCTCLHKLASTLVDHPHHTKEIQQLAYLIDSAVSGTAWAMNMDEAKRQYFLDNFNSRFPKTVIDPFPEEDSHFHERFLEFTLSKFHSLRNLSLVAHYHAEDGPSFYESFATHYTGEQILPSLQQLSIEHWDTEYGFDLGPLLPLLAMLKVPSIHLTACINVRPPAEFRDLVLPATRELILLGCAVDKDHMTRLVKMCPKITTLWYIVGSSTTFQAQDHLVSSEELTEILLPLRRTLTTLVISQLQSIDAEFLFGDNDDQTRLSINTLKEFTSLERLMIWQSDLFREVDGDLSEDDEEANAVKMVERVQKTFQVGDDVYEQWIWKLPSSLKHLIILVHNFDTLEPGLEELAACARERFPNLRKLTLDGAKWTKSSEVFAHSGINVIQTHDGRHPFFIDQGQSADLEGIWD